MHGRKENAENYISIRYIEWKCPVNETRDCLGRVHLKWNTFEVEHIVGGTFSGGIEKLMVGLTYGLQIFKNNWDFVMLGEEATWLRLALHGFSGLDIYFEWVGL